MNSKTNKRIENKVAPLGVIRAKHKNGFVAQIQDGGKRYRSSVVDTIEQAMFEYDKIVLRNNLNKKTFKVWKKL